MTYDPATLPPDLPVPKDDGRRLYKRLALVAERGRIVKLFYPVFPPDENAADVAAWLRVSASRS